MTPTQQAALCLLLNANSSLRWMPDPGAIGGGIMAFDTMGREVVRVVRRYKVLILATRGDDARFESMRRLGDCHGRGWEDKAAAMIREAIP